MDKYTISIANGVFIESDMDEGTNQLEYNRQTSFAEFEILDGKVHYMMNPYPLTDQILEECKDIEVLKQKVQFEVKRLNDRTWEVVEQFDGTFLDALDYIKENFVIEEEPAQ